MFSIINQEEMQIKTAIRYYHMPTRMTSIPESAVYGGLQLSCIVHENVKW